MERSLPTRVHKQLVLAHGPPAAAACVQYSGTPRPGCPLLCFQGSLNCHCSIVNSFKNPGGMKFSGIVGVWMKIKGHVTLEWPGIRAFVPAATAARELLRLELGARLGLCPVCDPPSVVLEGATGG